MLSVSGWTIQMWHWDFQTFHFYTTQPFNLFSWCLDWNLPGADNLPNRLFTSQTILLFSLDQLSCGSQPLLLAGYEDGSVVLWNLSMGKAMSRLVCHQEPVMSLDFDLEKTKGISGSSEKVLSIWSLNEQQNLQVRIIGPLLSFIPLCTNSLIEWKNIWSWRGVVADL